MGVIFDFTYWSSWGSSPALTSEHVFSNCTKPCATSLWPLATVRMAANYKKYLYFSIFNMCPFDALHSIHCIFDVFDMNSYSTVFNLN